MTNKMSQLKFQIIIFPPVQLFFWKKWLKPKLRKKIVMESKSEVRNINLTYFLFDTFLAKMIFQSIIINLKWFPAGITNKSN